MTRTEKTYWIKLQQHRNTIKQKWATEMLKVTKISTAWMYTRDFRNTNTTQSQATSWDPNESQPMNLAHSWPQEGE